jgi:hypothetical protein
MQAPSQGRALASNWRSKLQNVSRPSLSVKQAAPSSNDRRVAAGAAGAAASYTDVVAGAVEAIRRSPLGLELPSDHPGLAAIASSLVRGAATRGGISGARTRAHAPHHAPNPTNVTTDAHGGAHPFLRALHPAAPGPELRSPPPPLPPNPPLQEEGEISQAVMALVREHGLLDAKAMVTSDIKVTSTLGGHLAH